MSNRSIKEVPGGAKSGINGRTRNGSKGAEKDGVKSKTISVRMNTILNTGFALLVAFVLIASVGHQALAKKFEYPPAKKGGVVTNYFGTDIPDPYRWMEDEDSPQTLKWVEAENKLTHDYINSIPARPKIEKRFKELWNYPRYSLPYKHGDRYFFAKNSGLQNQYVVYMQKSLDAEPTVVIDPNKLSEDGTIALTNQESSYDGTLLAYGLSASGSDWQEIKIRKTDTRADYPETLEWCKFSSIAWKHDNSGFFYNRFPEEGTVPPEDRNNYNRVYWHKLGTDQSEDVLVYEDPEHKEWGFSPMITDDGKYLLLFAWHGTDDRNGILWREANSQEPFKILMDLGEAEYVPVDNIGSIFYFRTNLDAPRRRIITVDITHPAKENWKEIIPQDQNVISFASMVNDRLVVSYMQDAHNVLDIFDKDGTYLRELKLPTIGSVMGLSGRREDKEMFFGFSSFTYPYTAFRYDFAADKLTVFRRSEISFDPTGYETKEVFCTSKDGTKVPVFITYKKGLELNGDNPTLLNGYGGFNVSMTPYFSTSRIPWMECGGVFAMACLRGGDEYGEEWHKAGMLGNKQNVFDDFIAAAEWLIKNKYTNAHKLAITGASNGGLLVSACMIQRPDLFGAVIARVPVTDMLRYQKFTVGSYWVPEYGDAEKDSTAFHYLYDYSPLQNVKPGVEYPPTLVTTADTDDRVVPMHAKKFVATLQAYSPGDNPILLRVETKAGHGGGKPMTKIIEEYSDIYAFLFKTFDMKI